MDKPKHPGSHSYSNSLRQLEPRNQSHEEGDPTRNLALTDRPTFLGLQRSQMRLRRAHEAVTPVQFQGRQRAMEGYNDQTKLSSHLGDGKSSISKFPSPRSPERNQIGGVKVDKLTEWPRGLPPAAPNLLRKSISPPSTRRSSYETSTEIGNQSPTWTRKETQKSDQLKCVSKSPSTITHPGKDGSLRPTTLFEGTGAKGASNARNTSKPLNPSDDGTPAEHTSSGASSTTHSKDVSLESLPISPAVVIGGLSVDSDRRLSPSSQMQSKRVSTSNFVKIGFSHIQENIDDRVSNASDRSFSSEAAISGVSSTTSGRLSLKLKCHKCGEQQGTYSPLFKCTKCRRRFHAWCIDSMSPILQAS